ncbi:MAG: hypothetical protein Q7U47_08475 [Paludibacter sp.]|nr:hypothetical protein [Paludibacter sp.]
MDGRTIEKEKLITPPVNEEGFYNLHDFFKNDHHYYTPTAMFKSKLIKSITPKMQNQFNSYFGDWLLWIFLHLEGDYYFLNQCTAAYRTNMNSVTHTANLVDRWKADFVIRENLIKILPVEYHRYLTNSWHAYYRLSIAYRNNKRYLLFIYYQIISFLSHPLLYIERMKGIIFYKFFGSKNKKNIIR